MKEIKRKKNDRMKSKKQNASKEETRNIKEDAGH